MNKKDTRTQDYDALLVAMNQLTADARKACRAAAVWADGVCEDAEGRHPDAEITSLSDLDAQYSSALGAYDKLYRLHEHITAELRAIDDLIDRAEGGAS